MRRQDHNSFGSNRPSLTAYSDASKKFDEMIDAAHVLSHGEGHPSNERPIRERGGRDKEMEFEERKFKSFQERDKTKLFGSVKNSGVTKLDLDRSIQELE